MRGRFLLFLGLSVCFFPSPSACETYTTELGSRPLSLTITWLGPHRAYVTAETVTPVSRECLWKVLTDYDHLEEFIPHIQESRLLKRDFKKGFLLYQKAALWLGLYSIRTEVTFEVKESTSKQEVHFKAVEGDFRIHEGSWHLKEVPGGGTLLAYEATVEPDFWVPRWVLKVLERQVLKNTFRAILKRCR